MPFIIEIFVKKQIKCYNRYSFFTAKLMKEQLQAFLGKISSFFQGKIHISTKHKIEFLDQLGSLLNSGIPLTNSLKIIRYQTKNKSLQKMIDIILDNTNK